MPKNITANQLPGLMKPGHTVYIQNGSVQPITLVDAIKAHPDCAEGINFISMVNRLNPNDFTTLHPTAQQVTFFMTSLLRDGYDPSRMHILPLHLSGIFKYLTEVADIDIACIQVAPPDNNGHCSFGIAGDYVPAALAKATMIIAEVNPSLPVSIGAPGIAWDDIDYAVDANHLPLVWENKPPRDDVAALGRNVAGLVNDGDTIQLGVGTAPDAVLLALTDRRNLGVHTGMVPDALVDLVASGAVTGQNKSIDKGLIVTGSAMGTQRLYDFLDGDAPVAFRPVSYTHDVGVLKQIDNLRAINSVVEIDLLGQANCEFMNGRQIAGIGGQLDFIRGAKLSPGGISVQALQATAKGGTISRIVLKIPENAAGSVPRTDADYVITEYGVADLRFTPVNERAEKLIAIAAPQFRDELSNEWDRMQRTSR